ncbi:MAG: alkaline phosphatase family protein [Polyangiaceae bacterium]
MQLAIWKPLIAVSLFGLACGSTKVPDAPIDPRAPTPPEWDRQVARPDDATAATKRSSCGFARGAMPAETLGTSSPVDADIPIKTVVVLMMENRSFDSYYSHLNAFGNRTDIEVAPDGVTNPDAMGMPHARKHAEHYCFSDTNHEWVGTHEEVNGGKMDGFFMANQGKDATNPLEDGARALWFYDETEIPFYYALANTFGIADHYHAPLQGPTWPNRMYLYSATSFGRTSNALPDITAFPYPDSDAMIFDELEKRHIDWNIYGDGSIGAAIVASTHIVNRWGADRAPVLRIADFYAAAEAGTLPPVVFLDPKLGMEGPAQNDEHPPADLQLGEKFSSDIVQALMKSPQWKDLALFITYDEHGGLYDHVVPPKACPPDDKAPIFDPGDPTAPGVFDQEGVRVPLLVVSPYAKKGFVSHVTYDHASITRFIETKFKVPALTGRDANADPLLDFFDFKNPPFVTPPSLPDAPVNQAEADYCKATFAK